MRRIQMLVAALLDRSSLRAGFAFTLLGLSAVVAGGCHNNMTSLTVPLTYRPTSTMAEKSLVVTPTPGLKLFVEASDDRPDSAQIGENIENLKKPPVPILAGTPGPVDLVRDGANREFAGLGKTVVQDAGSATRTLSLSIVRFYCIESDVYRTDLRANASVRDNTGHVLWTGLVTGANTRFGRSLSTENYQESFSDSTVELVATLMRSGDFVRALGP